MVTEKEKTTKKTCFTHQSAENFLEHDTVLALKENQECANDPNRRNLMRPCPCNLGQAHTTKWGSMRFCKNFLGIQSLKGRMEHHKTINTCFRCLQLNHKANVCKAKLKCPYCSQVGKFSTKHNTALCAYLNDQEFEDAIKEKE